MSHVCAIKTVLKDMEAVKATCKELGLEFKENQQTYKWWGSSVGDYKVPAGFTAADLGKCTHAIGIPGSTWEVGVVKARNPDGTPAQGYTLMFDFFGTQGRPILAALGGETAGKFVQSYTLNKAAMDARKKGLFTKRVPGKNGAIQLHVTGY
jgi:hypothetical protein